MFLFVKKSLKQNMNVAMEKHASKKSLCIILFYLFLSSSPSPPPPSFFLYIVKWNKLVSHKKKCWVY